VIHWDEGIQPCRTRGLHEMLAFLRWFLRPTRALFGRQ
jgi:hypothetical protein